MENNTMNNIIIVEEMTKLNISRSIISDFKERNIKSIKIDDFLLNPNLIKFNETIMRKFDVEPETLDILSKNKNWFILAHVAAHKNTSTKTLLSMLQIKQEYIRGYVFDNPNMPLDRLLESVHDEDSFVRSILARNKRATINELQILSKDKDKYVRSAVLSNDNVTIELLKVLSKDTDMDIQLRAIEKLLKLGHKFKWVN